MVHWQIDLVADDYVRVRSMLVSKEVQRRDDGAIGRVLEGYDAVVKAVGLDCCEDCFDVGLGSQVILVWVEGLKGGLSMSSAHVLLAKGQCGSS